MQEHHNTVRGGLHIDFSIVCALGNGLAQRAQGVFRGSDFTAAMTGDINLAMNIETLHKSSTAHNPQNQCHTGNPPANPFYSPG